MMPAILQAPEGLASILDLEDGIYTGISNAKYHEKLLGVVSKGAIDHLLYAAAKYYAWVTGALVDEPTEALSFGQAFHCASLEPDKFKTTYVAAPSFGDLRRTARTSKEEARENKSRRDEWLVQNVGMLPLSVDDVDAIGGMLLSLQAHPLIGQFFTALWSGDSSIKTEVTLKWEDPETGLTCRARPDLLVPDDRFVIDIKTCRDARIHAFNRDRSKIRVPPPAAALL